VRAALTVDEDPGARGWRFIGIEFSVDRQWQGRGSW